MRLIEVDCPVCGRSSRKAVSIDRRSCLYGIQDTLLCRDCGMAWISPRPTARFLYRFYSGDYAAETYGLTGKDEVESVCKWRTRRARQKIGYFPDFWGKDLTVLEIGCGVGSFLAELKRRNRSRVWGIELVPEFIRVAEEKYGIRVFKGSFDDWRRDRPRSSPIRYDRIVLDQFLEHLPDPKGFLIGLKRHLEKDGAIFISVPNLAAPKMGRERYFIPEHLSLFSPHPLMRLLTDTGYFPMGMHAETPGSLQIIATCSKTSSRRTSRGIKTKPLRQADIRREFPRGRRDKLCG